MNKGSLVPIMATVLLVLSLLSPLAGAVSISYVADSGGESVSISEKYDVDNTVTVKESTDIHFGNFQVDQERTAEGTGKADLKQAISGESMNGTGYVAGNDIKSDGSVNAKTSSSATGDTLGTDQTVSATGDAESVLSGTQGGDSAMQKVEVSSGSLSSTQNMNIGHSASISQTANLEGTGYMKESAISNGNFVETRTSVEGSLSSILNTRAAGVAESSQRFKAEGDINQIIDLSDVEGTKKITNTVEGEGNYNIKRFLLMTEDRARFNQDIDCEGSVEGRLGGEEGDNTAGHVVKVKDGTLNSEQALVIGNSVHTLLYASIEGHSAAAGCSAANDNGYVYVDNFVGSFAGDAQLEFEGAASSTDDEVTAHQTSHAEGDLIWPWTEAENQYGSTFIENEI